VQLPDIGAAVPRGERRACLCIARRVIRSSPVRTRLCCPDTPVGTESGAPLCAASKALPFTSELSGRSSALTCASTSMLLARRESQTARWKGRLALIELRHPGVPMTRQAAWAARLTHLHDFRPVGFQLGRVRVRWPPSQGGCQLEGGLGAISKGGEGCLGVGARSAESRC
jgi:hypothetical protein